MKPQYQTLSQWIANPFGNQDHMKDSKYDALYRDYVASNKIKVVATTEIEGSYYIHISVPSESKSKEGYTYDVVIRFFTDSPEVKRNDGLTNYYIQFYSNSPGFIYKYAVLYKAHGFLIEQMYDMMDQNYADKLPEQTNADMKVSYDKTIYFACKYLSDNRFKILHKRGASMLIHRKQPSQFFKGIKSFERMKLDTAMIDLERKFQREYGKSGASRSHIPKPSAQQIMKRAKITKKKPTRSLISQRSSSGVRIIPKKTAGGAIAKRRATTTTIKHHK